MLHPTPLHQGWCPQDQGIQTLTQDLRLQILVHLLRPVSGNPATGLKVAHEGGLQNLGGLTAHTALAEGEHKALSLASVGS